MHASPFDSVIELKGLCKRFGSLTAVDYLDLAVPRGEVFGFLGPNGAGKSTTIRMLVDLIRPTSGEILLFGLPLRRHRRQVLARVGALVEKPDFYNHLSARQNLRILARMLGGLPRRRIDEVLDTVGLLDRAEDKVKTYSHGMRQRLGIAQALLGKPELIILDEPTIGLDPQGMREVRLLIRELAQQGMTVFLSSHLLHEVEQVCTAMAVINRGRLVVQGPVKELLQSRPSSLLLEVDSVPHFAEMLAVLPFVRRVEPLNRHWKVDIPYGEIPRLNRFLVEKGIRVYRMQPQTSLEDFYLSLVEER